MKYLNLDDIKDMSFYCVDKSYFFDYEIEQFLEHYKKRKQYIEIYKNYIIDAEALSNKINMNCLQCFNKVGAICCEGIPYNFTKKEIKNIRDVTIDLSEYYKEDEKKDILMQGFFGKYDIPKFNKDKICIFHKDGGCIIHDYALNHKNSLYDLKTLSCSLLPLDILLIEMKDKEQYLYFSSVTNREFAKISRWDWVLEYDKNKIKCLNSDESDNVFKAEEYKPMYKSFKELIVYYFDIKLYNFIDKKVRDKYD